MIYLFGKSFDYSFTPIVTDETVSPNSLVSARLYTDEPTDAEKDDSGALLGTEVENVTSWSDGTQTNEKLITFSAVTDSNPHDADPYEVYWIVVSFKFDAAGPTVFSSDSILLYRPDAWTSRISVVYSDLPKFENKFSDLLSNAEMTNHVNIAKDRIFRVLRAKGYSRQELGRLRELNDATKYMAVASACRDLAGEENQFWWDKYQDYQAQAFEILNQTPVGVDVNGDGVIDEGESTELGSVAYMMR